LYARFRLAFNLPQNSNPPARSSFTADAYHALADNGYLDDTVFIVTFDEWGGFYDHVPPQTFGGIPGLTRTSGMWLKGSREA
jgi:phospholipase C